MSKQTKITPLMQQYFDIKTQYQDAIVLFQVGDFYELFFDDAKTVSSFLGITLTARGTHDEQPIPLCGFPLHNAQHHIAKLVKGNFKVVVCDQLEEATPGKMVARGVTRVLTPGTLLAQEFLDEKSSTFLLSFCPTKQGWGLIFSELVSAQMYGTVLSVDDMRQLESELYRFLPQEVVVGQSSGIAGFVSFFKSKGFFTSFAPGNSDEFENWLKTLDFQTKELLEKQGALHQSMAQWHAYIAKYQPHALQACKAVQWYEPEAFLQLDTLTLRHLDVVKNSYTQSKEYTLFGFLDQAQTPMGSRLIKRWLVRPLQDEQAIQQRLDFVSFFLQNPSLMAHIRAVLKECGDIERVVGRIVLDRATVSDFLQVKRFTQLLPDIIRILVPWQGHAAVDLVLSQLYDFSELHDLLNRSLYDGFEKEYLITSGFDERVDQMRDLVEHANKKILRLEISEQDRTGISGLKIRHNSVQGYYIELTKMQAETVPADYKRLQTLVGKERFMTDQLAQLQYEITHAAQMMTRLEKEIFEQIKMQVRIFMPALRSVIKVLTRVDALVSFAFVAGQYGYVRPEFTEQQEIVLKDVKHPLLQEQLGSQCIGNDVMFHDKQKLLVITGPNMGGKSTYLRQTAIVHIMAQAGSFVCAKQATIPILDKIFTRIGAGDNIAQGKSTFLVEMEETAFICQHATSRSLLILDEIGRGTSTFDGIAIAQSVLEYVYSQIGSYCLFATHYQELTELAQDHEGIVNYYAASSMQGDQIVFLHKIVPGRAHGSFGIQVAKLAGLPKSVIARAQKVYQHHAAHGQGTQQPLFSVQPATKIDEKDKVILEEIKSTKLDEMTPKQVMQWAYDLQEKMKE